MAQIGATAIGARVNLPNTVASKVGANITIEGADGVTTGVILEVTAADTAAEVANTIALAMENQFLTPGTDIPNLFQTVKVDGDLLHIIGHDVTDEGPLPFSDELAGDLPTNAPG